MLEAADPAAVQALLGSAEGLLEGVLGTGAPERTLAWCQGVAVGLERFHGQVRALATQLPAGRHVVNLCEDRYRFMVAFCAIALRGQVNLLPPSRAPEVVRQVMEAHPGCHALGDTPADPLPPRWLAFPDPLAPLPGPPPCVDTGALVALAYTSGSTGTPRAHGKTLAQFLTSTRQLVHAVADLWNGQVPQIVATVPAQHMFGLEQSVLVPLLAGAAVHGGRPFFPQDVARALAQVPAPRMLVTTPVHLRALVASGVALPPLAGIVSATAPLDPALARAAEQAFETEVREIFGSTETCIFARRRTARESAWTPLPGVRVQPQPDGMAVHAPHLAQPVVLPDVVELVGQGRFVLRGRQADLLEIAGKRASLGDLSRRLLAVPGVRDGVMLQSARADALGVRRIAAVVVAPALEETALLAALREAMDPVFLPRRIRFVQALPRNETGKLVQAEVMALLKD